MIVPSDHIRNFHIIIINHDTKIIGWKSIRARDNQIIKLSIIH